MYTPEEIAIAKAFVLEKVSGGLSLEAVIRADQDMILPHVSTIYKWMQEGQENFDPVFYENYARAYDLRANKIFEETLQIADDGSNDTYIDPETGKTYTNYDVVQRSKLRIEARQWALARMNSKRFGNKVETTLQGGDKPIETVNYEKLSTSALEEIAKNAADAAQARSK